MNINFNHESYRPPNNESVSTIRVFDFHGVETQRLEDTADGHYALCQSFLGVAKAWGWQLHPDMAEALEANMAGLLIKSWPIGTAKQWESGALGTVQFVGKFKQ